MGRAGERKHLDELDAQLLALLRQDARRAISDLAAVLGVSRATVYARIGRLEQDGIVEGYTVRLGVEHERRMIRAHVMIKVLPKLNGVAGEALIAMPELTALHAISGEYDMIAMIEAEDVGALNALIDRIGMLDGVDKTTSSIILATKLQR